MEQAHSSKQRELTEDEQRELATKKALFQLQHEQWLNLPTTQRVLAGLEKIRQLLVDNAENRTNLESVTDRETTKKIIQTNQLKETIKTIKNYENFI